MMTEMSSGGGKAVDSIMLVYFGSYVLRINVEMKLYNEVSQAVIRENESIP